MSRCSTTEFCWRVARRQRGADDPQAEGLRQRRARCRASRSALMARIQDDPRRPRAAGDDAVRAADERQRPPAAAAGAVVDAPHGNESELIDATSSIRRCRKSSTASASTWATAPPNGRGTRASSAAAQRAHLLPGVLSARMWIKQENQECEDLLAHWAEPFSTWADMLQKQVGPTSGASRCRRRPRTCPSRREEASIAALIDRAWRHLLENQPHDSICGCSVDTVHEEMRQRYDWVKRDRRGDRAAVPADDRRRSARTTRWARSPSSTRRRSPRRAS